MRFFHFSSISTVCFVFIALTPPLVAIKENRPVTQTIKVLGVTWMTRIEPSEIAKK